MSPPTASPKLEWHKAKSAEGKEYRVGLPAGDKPEVTPEAVRGLPPFSQPVDWPVGQEGEWVATTPDVEATTAISRYNLYANSGGGEYAYTLWFTNNAHYDYWFKDASGDSYQVNTFVDGDHWVEYNSPNPTILLVTGS
ncbi:hypothetical protein FRC08_004927 [Ceratobasidium sp. 394]|nr:hypothetical protein FRC08_004927 [Ceratobasidium sp. 394]